MSIYIVGKVFSRDSTCSHQNTSCQTTAAHPSRASVSMDSVTAPRSSILQIQVKVASQGVGGCLRGLVQPWEHMKACTFRRESHDRPNWHACLPIAKHFVRLFLGAAWLENFLSEHPLFCPKPLSLAQQLSGNVSAVARGLRTAENGPKYALLQQCRIPGKGRGLIFIIRRTSTA